MMMMEESLVVLSDVDIRRRRPARTRSWKLVVRINIIVDVVALLFLLLLIPAVTTTVSSAGVQQVREIWRRM
jgi:hypothetical protein